MGFSLERWLLQGNTQGEFTRVQQKGIAIGFIGGAKITPQGDSRRNNLIVRRNWNHLETGMCAGRVKPAVNSGRRVGPLGGGVLPWWKLHGAETQTAKSADRHSMTERLAPGSAKLPDAGSTSAGEIAQIQTATPPPVWRI